MIRSLLDTCAAPPPWETWKTRKIRIAVIDTGIDMESDILIETALEAGSIKHCRGFAGDAEDYHDSHGHGTRIARLITIEVDIISLSFGLEPDNRNVDINKAIFNAVSNNTIVFAAAANNGGNKPRAYPANRRTGVICIHASDGRGNDGGISPSPEPRKSNFSTLGISIESRWKGKKVLKSGTSFATPIAVALAANMLEFAMYKCSLDEYEQRRLHSYDSIEELLHLMSKERQGYDYIMPLHLWSGNTEAAITRKLVDIARS
ncbi:hypothetical protein TARUN_4841 [Trichoderma arundinaceum]|uniref:Peptidase S8/S53 domain-containing protein n=1 Tax=Trichoderma arundinaceum TaxID=490622 RepID=A0A395NNC8_TRIAR|nr:hypothetical protein TARUN_4841 [Trichoderma arundinaceum]